MDILDNILGDISTTEYKKVEFKMRIAARIDIAMKAKGINKTELARGLGKNSPAITRWLSGGWNFTIDTLVEIGDFLGVDLFQEPKPLLCKPCNFESKVLNPLPH